MISEKANVRMQAALHAIRPAEVALPESLAAGVTQDGEMPRSESLTDLLGQALAYARTCLRAADRPVTALFAISEPHDGDIPVTTRVTFLEELFGEEFDDAPQPLMLLSNEPATFLYACDDRQFAVMSETADALVVRGVPREEAVARINEFWADSSRRYSLLYGGWIGQQSGAEWASRM